MLKIDRDKLELTSQRAIAYKNWVTDNSIAYMKNPGISLGYQYNAFRAAEVFHLWGGDDNARAAVKLSLAYVRSEHEIMKTFVPGPKGKEWEQKNLPLIMQNSMLDAHILIGNLAHTIAWCRSFMTAAERSEIVDWGIQCCRAFIQTDPNVMLDGKPVWWSRWSINDPSNNYYHSFTDTVVRFGLAADDKAITDHGRIMLLAIANTFAKNKGGGSPEGNGYGLSLGLVGETFGIWGDSVGEYFPEVTKYFSETLLYFCHATEPSFNSIVPIGDQARDRFHWISDADKELVLRAYPLANDIGKGLAAWWLKTVSLGEGQWGRPALGRNELIAIKAAPTPPPSTSYTAETVGVTFWRSSWDKNADYIVVCHGPIDQAHAHDDQGSIHIHSKGKRLLTSQSANSRTGILQEPEFQNALIVEERKIVSGGVFDGVETWTRIRPDKKSIPVVTFSPDKITITMLGYGAKCAWTRTIERVGKLVKISDSVTPFAGYRARLAWNTPQPVALNNTDAVIGTTPFKFSTTAGTPAITVFDYKKLLPAENGEYGGYRIEVSAPGAVTYLTEIQLDADVVVPPTPTPPTPTPPTPVPPTPTPPTPTPVDPAEIAALKLEIAELTQTLELKGFQVMDLEKEVRDIEEELTAANDLNTVLKTELTAAKLTLEQLRAAWAILAKLSV
jgi:hypothetical protein